MSRHPLSQIPFFSLSLLTLVVVCLLPARLLGWAVMLSEPLEAVIAPFGHAGSATAYWLRPARNSLRVQGGGDEVVAALRAEAQEMKTLALRRQEQIDRLQIELEQLRQARSLQPESHDQLLNFPVIRSASDLGSSLIKIKGGRRQGILPGAVAVYRGVHLVGRVSRVGNLTSTIQPITDTGSDLLECVIMPPDGGSSLASGARCQLEPATDGADAFTGDVQRGSEWLQTIGDEQLIVRLQDPHWPDGAQALIVGLVEEIYTSDANPLRLRVRVRPQYWPLDRLPEVTLRLPTVANRTEPQLLPSQATEEP